MGDCRDALLQRCEFRTWFIQSYEPWGQAPGCVSQHTTDQLCGFEEPLLETVSSPGSTGRVVEVENEM